MKLTEQLPSMIVELLFLESKARAVHVTQIPIGSLRFLDFLTLRKQRLDDRICLELLNALA